MEVSIVLIKKVLIVVLLFGTLSAYASDEAMSYNELSAYYGFDEIELIKLDWGIRDLRIADFNNDGRNDIAVANNRKARIDLLIQKENIGPGEVEVAVDPNDIDINLLTAPTRFDNQKLAVSQKIFCLVCGDLNSDGLTDLAFYGEPRGLYVILQRSEQDQPENAMTLNWRTRQKININDGLLNSNMLVCEDINNDKKDDLILAAGDGIYVILQKESGSLAEPVKYPVSAQTLGIRVDDLDGDNINDLIVVTNDSEKPIQVRYGLTTGQLGPEVQYFIERPFALELYNLDEDKGTEILTVDSLSGRLMCYKLADDKRKDVDWPTLFYPLISGQSDTKRDLVLGDFDGDGLTDVVISQPAAAELVFYRQVPGVGLTEPVRFPAFSDITSLSAMDINSDGKSELGMLSVKEKNIGISEFENDRLDFPEPVNLTDEPVAMELADIDIDGAADCVYVSRDDKDQRNLRIIYNVSDTDNKQIDSLLKLEKLNSNPDGIKVLDVDQDGLNDVLIFVSYELPILVRQTQSRQFEVVDSANTQMSLIKDASLRSTFVADVDGKPGRELMVAQNNFARSLVFSKGQNWSVIDQYNAKSTENQVSAAAALNLDGDTSAGNPSILLLDGQKGMLQILKAGEDETYRIEKELDVGTWNTADHLKILYAPLTGGNDKSILIFDSAKFAIITPPDDDNAAKYLEQQFSYETEMKEGIYGNLVAGDINSDGRMDIIMVEYRRNNLEILTLDAEQKPVPAFRFKIFEQKSYRDAETRTKAAVEPREMMVADVTGDGKEDLVTIIHDRIIIYPQD
jgi:hypothetical protein